MANLPESASTAMSAEEAIAMFDIMVPSREVVRSREMEQMFPSIIAAMKRDVSEEQIIAGLRKKWPDAHVATIIKLLNAERERRLVQDGPAACKRFGSPRKSKKTAKGHQAREASNADDGSCGADA